MMNKIIVLAFVVLLTSGCDKLNKQWQASNKTPFSLMISCVEYWEEYLHSNKAGEMCFEEHSVSSRSIRPTGTMARARKLFEYDFGSEPWIVNEHKAFISLSSVGVIFENIKTGDVNRYTFECDFKIIEPLSSAWLVCGDNEAEKQDLIGEYQDGELWDYSWSIGSYKVVNLESADFLH